MTIRPGYKPRMPTLLRTAPNIDVEELREKMVRAALQAVQDRGLPDSDSNAALVRAFADGQAHTLPDRWGLSDILYSLLERATTLPDEGLYSAHDVFRCYFFSSDYDLGI